MDKLQNLLTNLNENKNIIRFKELELAIKNNDTLNNQYNELIKVQKKVVNNEHYNLKDSDLKTEYITKLNQLKGNPVIDEYLELIDLINEDILMITSIIEDEISNPLKWVYLTFLFYQIKGNCFLKRFPIDYKWDVMYNDIIRTKIG